MIRAFWSLVVAMLWVRQRFALSRSVKALKAWEAFCDKTLTLKPGRNESIETHVKHALAQEKADSLADKAGKDKARFARRHKAYTRARDFMPRWAWAYVPYAEISALGVAVG